MEIAEGGGRIIATVCEGVRYLGGARGVMLGGGSILHDNRLHMTINYYITPACY